MENKSIPYTYTRYDVFNYLMAKSAYEVLKERLDVRGILYQRHPKTQEYLFNYFLTRNDVTLFKEQNMKGYERLKQRAENFECRYSPRAIDAWLQDIVLGRDAEIHKQGTTDFKYVQIKVANHKSKYAFSDLPNHYREYVDYILFGIHDGNKIRRIKLFKIADIDAGRIYEDSTQYKPVLTMHINSKN